MADEPEVITFAELGDDGDPPYDARVPIALAAATPEEYQDEILRTTQAQRDRQHDEWIAQQILAMEAAGVPGEDIVDLLVDEFARGETW